MEQKWVALLANAAHHGGRLDGTAYRALDVARLGAGEAAALSAWNRPRRPAPAAASSPTRRCATAKEDTAGARRAIQQLGAVYIRLDDLTTQLEGDGIMDAFDKLTAETAKKVEALRREEKQPVG